MYQEPDFAMHDGGNITLESLTQFEERFTQIDAIAEEALAEHQPIGISIRQADCPEYMGGGASRSGRLLAIALRVRHVSRKLS